MLHIFSSVSQSEEAELESCKDHEVAQAHRPGRKCSGFKGFEGVSGVPARGTIRVLQGLYRGLRVWAEGLAVSGAGVWG